MKFVMVWLTRIIVRIWIFFFVFREGEGVKSRREVIFF